jgi:hypothetical protein
MTQYIDKDALVAEIKKIYNEGYKFLLPSDIVESVQDFKDDLLIALDTLEVKEEIKIGEPKIYLREAHYDRKQWLDLSYTKYEVPKGKFKDGDKVELIIRKTQKGK